jgi:hypothetical protein
VGELHQTEGLRGDDYIFAMVGNIEIEVGIFQRPRVGADKVGPPFGSSPQNDLQYQWVVEVTGGHQGA